MTDLVKQLRQKNFKVVNENGYTEIGSRWGPLFEEAADRIESLEDALVEISRLNNCRDRFSPEIDAVIYKALENNND